MEPLLVGELLDCTGRSSAKAASGAPDGGRRWTKNEQPGSGCSVD
jgi:hypothetical protein